MGRVRFEGFEFDQTSGDLRRDGKVVRLQPQPSQVLSLLIVAHGQVVTRESLRQAIWGNDTFVDFDRGLNFCISQIRSALGDSAESPAFIRTVPKRGYQFIAPLEQPVVSRKLRVGHGTLVLLALVLLSILLIWQPWSRPPITIAVARFDNETGNPDLDRFADGLTDSLVTELTNAGKYEVIGNASILRQPRDRRDLSAIGSSLKAGYVVIGQVQQNDSRLRVLAHLIRLPDQKHLTVTRFEQALDDPLGLQTRIAQQIRTDFARRLASASN